MHIGLYFGSFNPIHHGHLIIASYARHTSHLDQVWLMVSPQNPLKPASSLLNEYQRLHLVNLAIQDDTSLRAMDIEFHLPKPSYTVDTMAYLREKYPQHQFTIILGADSLENLSNWKNYQALIQHHPFLVFNRPGFTIENKVGARITVAAAPLLEISSTQIRQFIKSGVPIRYMVPELVVEEIERCNYYK